MTLNKDKIMYGNDLADFQKLDDVLIPGKCYAEGHDGLVMCNNRCQRGVVGIASDTYGYGLGELEGAIQVPISIAGWVLAFVENSTIYAAGNPLTNNENGDLCCMTSHELQTYPERIVAIYSRPELSIEFGPGKIKVNGRHWVRVK